MNPDDKWTWIGEERDAYAVVTLFGSWLIPYAKSLLLAPPIHRWFCRMRIGRNLRERDMHVMVYSHEQQDTSSWGGTISMGATDVRSVQFSAVQQ